MPTGSAWAPGVNDEVIALAVSGTNLYAGGYFTTAGGVTANRIAKWDGRAWSALGSGMDRRILAADVFAVAVSGINLYAGGQSCYGGRRCWPATIAKWDGSAWSSFRGSGMFASEEDVRGRVAGGMSGREYSTLAGNFAMGRRSNGHEHRQMGRQRLVGLGSGDERRWQRLGVDGDRDQSLRWGNLHHGGRGAGQATSPNGTAAPGRPWARG